MKLIKPKTTNPGDHKTIAAEPSENLSFIVHKFSDRPRPKKEETVIFSCFSEFGCEIVGVMYVIPFLMQRYPGKYRIAIGWHGRPFLYKHLVDEFWELKIEHQWLREYCRAFHHQSKNLRKVEKEMRSYGVVINSEKMGRYALTSSCLNCHAAWTSMQTYPYCPKCKGNNILPAILGGIKFWKPRAVKVPRPSRSKMEKADEILKGMNNAVGVFARGRKCYGRNLQPEFYEELLYLLESLGYDPIWLGEKQTTQPCPLSHILDFSRCEDSRDLELTLAIVSKLKFTVQFWTASTRLSSLVGTPYLLFESPDQIWGNGQEGIRRNLCDFGHTKLAACHFLNVYNNNRAGVELVVRCIDEMSVDNYNDVFGLLENEDTVASMRLDYLRRHNLV